MPLTGHPRPKSAVLCLALALFAAAPALAQSGDAFGIQIVRGPRPVATARAVDSTVRTDAEGSVLRAVAARPSPATDGGYSAGYFRGDTLGVVLLPRYPAHQVWWDWTQDYRRYYAGRVY